MTVVRSGISATRRREAAGVHRLSDQDQRRPTILGSSFPVDRGFGVGMLFAELISPERVVFQGEVRSVVLSGVEGDMTVLPGHASVVTLLFPAWSLRPMSRGRGVGLSCGAASSRSPGPRSPSLPNGCSVEELTRKRIDDEIHTFSSSATPRVTWRAAPRPTQRSAGWRSSKTAWVSSSVHLPPGSARRSSPSHASCHSVDVVAGG